MGGNVYLLGGDALTLVDTGMPGGADRVMDYVVEIGRKPADLTRILLTHYHVDHVGSAAEIKERTGAAVVAHPADAPYIDGSKPQPPPRQALLRLLQRFVPAMSRFPKVSPDELVVDGDRIDVLGGATVLHIPGHTPGSIALHVRGEGVLLCGDAINHRRERLGPPPAGFTVDAQQASASIRRLAELQFEVLCTGHGEPIIGAAAAQVRAMAAGLD
jgi:glyoxylase-like metal-dependent hydrolase (beta-lactamase superfamily II)